MRITTLENVHNPQKNSQKKVWGDHRKLAAIFLLAVGVLRVIV